MTILVTGFGPFGRWKVNPSERVVQALAKQAHLRGEGDLVTEILPTEYVRAGKRIRQLLRRIRPGAVVCLGVAFARRAISLERIALNLDDDPLPDNAGQIRSGCLIVRGGAAAYWSTLPLEQLRRALVKRGIPVTVSNHAGAYLCNHVFYLARHEMELLGNHAPCGFIHVPGLRSRRGTSKTIPLNQMVEAIECCLQVLRRRSRS
ncbi:MAG: pyroglutamyl-peptidase I [Acidobacteria bacterium]|nr:pyroglutamyl-peptidase I [Acidobacteriota bacterium]